MRTLNQQDALDPRSLLYYAPRRLRDCASDLATIQPLPGENGQSEPDSFSVAKPDDGAASAPGPFPKSLQLIFQGISRPNATSADARKKGLSLAIAGSLAAVAGIVVAIAFVNTVKSTGDRDGALSLNEAGTPVGAPAIVPAPTLAVGDASGEVNELLPLGIKVSSFAPGATVSVSGLLDGAEMSTGAASGAGRWVIAVDDLPRTLVIPPRDFLGPMTLVAELNGRDGRAIVRSPVRFLWKQPEGDDAAKPSPPADTPIPTAPVAPRQIDPTEAAALMKRAGEMVAAGDLPAARLLLTRVAEAHNARAAFELGATYDPQTIKQVDTISAAPDPALARAWYRKARDWGLPDASRRLDALASADH